MTEISQGESREAVAAASVDRWITPPPEVGELFFHSFLANARWNVRTVWMCNMPTCALRAVWRDGTTIVCSIWVVDGGKKIVENCDIDAAAKR